MSWDEVVEIVSAFHGAELSTSYGDPAFKVGGVMILCLRLKLASLVIPGVPSEERDMLCAAFPDVFHFTAHYQYYPMVLARLETIDSDTLRSFVSRNIGAAKSRRNRKAKPLWKA